MLGRFSNAKFGWTVLALVLLLFAYKGSLAPNMQTEPDGQTGLRSQSGQQQLQSKVRTAVLAVEQDPNSVLAKNTSLASLMNQIADSEVDAKADNVQASSQALTKIDDLAQHDPVVMATHDDMAQSDRDKLPATSMPKPDDLSGYDLPTPDATQKPASPESRNPSTTDKVVPGLGTTSQGVTDGAGQPLVPGIKYVRGLDFVGSRLYVGVGSGHWINENSNGKFIELEDGSTWEVSLVDQVDSALWLPVTDITVIESNNPLYPYRLINRDDGETVEARLVHQ